MAEQTNDSGMTFEFTHFDIGDVVEITCDHDHRRYSVVGYGVRNDFNQKAVMYLLDAIPEDENKNIIAVHAPYLRRVEDGTEW